MAASPGDMNRAQHGVNVAGFLQSDIGIGEAARRLVSAVERSRVPFVTIGYRGPTLSRRYPSVRRRAAPVYDTNIVCVNAESVPEFAADVGPEFFSGRYSIGFWFWEVSRFPDAMRGAFDYLDEVWVASDFARAPIAAATDKPVVKIPVPIEPPVRVTPDRSRFALPDGFMFLFTFNFYSVFERKNPVAVIEAFKRAFAARDDALLVVKSSNGDKWPHLLETMRTAARGRDDIFVVDGYTAVDDYHALMASCDCYVSLHRSEGWGLGMAEAMALGKPVIATAYSGNLEFMSEDNSHLVRYELAHVPPGLRPYPQGAEWAEPDVDAAASAMRRVYEDRAAARALGERAQTDVLQRLSPERAGAAVADRLNEVWRAPAGTEPRRAAIERRPSSVERLLAEVTRAPHAPLVSEGQGLSARVRQALARALWPYLVHRSSVDKRIVDALLDLEFRVHELEARLDERAND